MSGLLGPTISAVKAKSIPYSVGLTFINSQFAADGSGMCRLDAAGDKLPCPEAFGAFLGTASVVAVIAVALSFLPPRTIKKVSLFCLSGGRSYCEWEWPKHDPRRRRSVAGREPGTQTLTSSACCRCSRPSSLAWS